MPHHMQGAAERFSSSKRLASVLFLFKSQKMSGEHFTFRSFVKHNTTHHFGIETFGRRRLENKNA